MENFVDKLCRLCLKESEDTADLFDYKNGHLIADLIKIICPVTIERNESEKLPSKVCVDCLELVVDAIHLRDLSIINDQELRGSLTLCPDVKCEEIEECEEIYVEALDEASLEIEKLECTQYLLVTSDVESLVIPSKAVSNSSYCHVCSETFCNQSSLKRHQLRKHKNVEYTCDLCDTSFKTKRDIEVHMRREHRRNQGVRFLYSEKLNVDLSDMYEKLEEPEGMVCSFCSYVDYDEVSLNEHLTTHQEVVDSGKMYCIHCPSPIDTMQFMISHTRTHNEKLKTHRCRICNKTFPFDDKFINHLRNHRKNQNKICFCPECGKKFSKPRMLDDHIRFIHNKESMFCCNQCGQNFGSKSALNGHIRRHVEGQKYQCPFCPKTFSSHNLLNSHKTVHSTERPYACNYCDKRFKKPKILNDHIKRHEGKNPCYICSICERTLNNSFALSRHMLTHTGLKPHQCELCPKAYAQKNDLNKHLRSHIGENTYFCDFPGCSLSFRIISDLKIHQGVHYVGLK